MYNKYFYINKNFQSSINLELDLNNESKIYEYIPTTDICDVLKKYIKSVIGDTKERATTLVGPYGKGKSFLLLILNYLLGKNKSSKCWKDLVDKIELVDKELYDLLIKIKKEDISLMTVIINSNYDNIKQSFLIALSESLKRENLDDIIPNTVFDVCIDLIKKWENDPKTKNDILMKCLEIHKIKLSKLKNDLSQCSYKAYKQFEELYNCVNIGLAFNPLVNNDIVKIYKDVVTALSDKGYSGMFIVFDEFSKFLESNSVDLMQDLKVIQDVAEAANSSSKSNQINLCCVTHKSFALYLGKGKKGTVVDSFKTVEGRFKEIKFNRSLEENYQLISSAIYKKENADKISEKFIEDNIDFYERINAINLFEIFDKETLVYKNCFPLNPLTVFNLIHLSELVAQNERTLFTFLSDSDEHSLNSFINNNNSGLFNVDKVYDYFNVLLQKEEANFIRNIWYRAESILSKLDTILEKRVIKVIAILLMVNDFDKLPCNEELISLSLHIEINEIQKVINSLLDKHLLRRNLLNNLLSFALSNSKNIDENIEVLSKTKFKNIKYSDVLDKINDKKFIVPRRYNEENKITRFFSVLFMEEKEFENLYNFDYYFENKYCDGLIINLMIDSLSEKDIVKKIKNINDPRVVVRWPNMPIDKNLYQIVMRYACLEDIKLNKDIDEISNEEINLLLEENEIDLLVLIDLYYNKTNKFYNSISMNGSFNEVLSSVMEQIYSYKLIFNNELVNKKTISSQYQKAVNHVIDYLINNAEDFPYSETSPEMSIKYSVLDFNEENDEFRELISDIKNTITCSVGKKIPVVNIIDKYRYEPYGIREGILPILLAKAISELSDNIILYLQSKEIELNSSNLVKAVSGTKYFISFSKSSIEQLKYLNNLMNLFEVKQSQNFRKDVINLADTIRKYFIGLPKIVRTCSEKSNCLKFKNEFIKYKAIFLGFNVNPYEVIFEEPKYIFNVKKYETLFVEIKNTLSMIEENLSNYKIELVNKTKILFGVDLSTSLKMGLCDWYDKNSKEGRVLILSDKNKRIQECLLNQINHDDIYSINLICKATVNAFIEDWDNDRSIELIEELKAFVDNINNAEYIQEDTQNLLNILDNKNDDLSDMALVLKDSILSVFEEYADSVENAEKIAVLKELIKGLL